LAEEKNKLQKLKEEIVVWRFLLTSYYLIHGETFGKNKHPMLLSEIKTEFEEKLKKKKKKLMENR
jgi:hypothetical protein